MKFLQAYLPLIALILLSFFAYQTSFNHSFTNLDDQVQVVQNTHIKSLDIESLKSIFSSTSVGMYQPVSTLIYAFVYQVGGLNPWNFHFTSWLFHLLNGFILLMIFKKLSFRCSTSYLMLSIFLLHPLQVESVSWVSAFSNLCFSFFYLLALLFYIQWKQENHNKFYFLSLLAFLFGLLSKSSAVTLPLILLAFDFFHDTKQPLKKLTNKVPFFLLSLIFGIITLKSREAAGHLSDLSIQFSLFDRLFLVSYSTLFYPLKFLWPFNLSAFYPYPELQNGFLPWRYYLSLPLFLGGCYLIYRFRQNRKLYFGALLYLLSISVTLQLIPVGNQLTTDRYIYLPMVGILIMIASFISKTNKKIIGLVTLLVASILAGATFNRAKIWKNDQSIWTNVLEQYPKVAQAHNNLGSFLLQKGEPTLAFKHFNQAVKLKPYYADAYSNRGNLYSQFGESEKAMADFEKAIALRPHADAYFNRANEKVKLEEFRSALEDYNQSIALQASADAFTNRAYVYLRLGKQNLAIKDLNQAIYLNPDFSQAYFLKGMVVEKLGKASEACNHFKKAANLGHSKAKQAMLQFCS